MRRLLLLANSIALRNFEDALVHGNIVIPNIRNADLAQSMFVQRKKKKFP